MQPKAMFCTAIFTLFALLFKNINGSVVGIDFASDSMKIAIIQPGTPLEIGNLQQLYIFLSHFN
jgi:hypothetical protein